MSEIRGALRRIAAMIAVALLITNVPAGAHEGEDHGAPPAATAATATPSGPSGEAHSGRFEVVVTGSEDGRLTVYLDDYATNAPVEGARLILSVADRQVQASAVSPGTYEARLAAALPHGTTNVVVQVRGVGADEQLNVPVVVPEHEENVAGESSFDMRSVLLGAGALALLLGAAFLAYRLLWRRPAVVASIAVLVTFLAMTPGVQAHGDEPPPATGEGGASSHRPVRESDGSVSLPKPSQRLLGIRTIIGEQGTGSAASRLQAEVVPDPARFARLATARGGRVLASGTGFPRPGQPVAAGQVLFQLQPALSASEAASSAAEVRSLEREVRLAEQELGRLEQLRGIVARADIERARTNLAGLRAQRGAAAGPVNQVESVRAPIGGTVSAISTAIGAVVEPGGQLAEIVGNGGWLVEARGLAPGQRLASQSATGVTTDGRRFGLRLLGRTPQQVDGSDRFLFAVSDGAGTLRGGEAITVEATLVGSAVRQGIVLPAEAITRGASGESIAWVKPSALRFVPRQVRTQPLPGGRLLVLAGLRPGERIVMQGAGLLGQIR
jgi:RND family efflux transporter MFP subunit